jgi:hypothetical protein
MATSLEEAATTKDGAFTARRIPRNGFYDEKTLNVSDAGRSYFDLMGLYKLPFLVR